MSSAIVVSALSFSWPDGTCVLQHLNVAFGAGRTGLIGVNGSGKSTLLRVIAGVLRPTAGAVTVTGDVGYLPQDLTLDKEASVAGLLGIDATRDALRAIEAGDTSQAAFDVVGDDWDVEDRARAVLDRLGLAHIGLDERVGRLSGGEAVMTALAALFLRQPGIMLLDEPTNNLDLDARHKLYAAVASWPGAMLIVSHDRELLGLVDQVAELSGATLRMYGGSLADYEGMRASQQAAAERAVGAAAADVRRERRDLIESQVKQARRDRQGRRLADSGSLPRMAAHARKRAVQQTAGRSREMHTERLETATARLREAEQAVRADAEIRIDLPGTAVPAGRTVLAVTGLDSAWHPSAQPRAAARVHHGEPSDDHHYLAAFTVQGPERLALTGPNGAGKTTLLRAIAGQASLEGVVVRRHGALGYLPQRLDILDESLTVAENVRAAAPAATVNEVHAGLARFLFRGARAGQHASDLSGGERFRAVLAALLLAQPPPQLLLLDEPTNNLDMASVRHLSQALDRYQGAVIVVSHDLPFLRSCRITRWLRLDRQGRMTSSDRSVGRLGGNTRPGRRVEPGR